MVSMEQAAYSSTSAPVPHCRPPFFPSRPDPRGPREKTPAPPGFASHKSPPPNFCVARFRPDNFRRRPLALVHYSRDSLRLASAFSTDAQGAERTLAGWHELLELAGYRVDFIDDAGLVLVRADTAAVLFCPSSPWRATRSSHTSRATPGFSWSDRIQPSATAKGGSGNSVCPPSARAPGAWTSDFGAISAPCPLPRNFRNRRAGVACGPGRRPSSPRAWITATPSPCTTPREA